MGKKILINKDRAELLSQADALLVRLAETEGIIKTDLEKMAAEIKAIEDRHARFNEGMNNLLKDLEKQLDSLMKKNAGIVFDGEERVDLKHGALLFVVESRVIKAKGLLEKLKKLGFRDAIKVAEAVDWDEVEKWPVEKLALVGTKRARKEVYSWETKPEVGDRKSEVG